MDGSRNISNFATSWTADDPPYVILKWRIENFSHLRSALKSPCFVAGRTSKWNLVLDPNPNSGSEEEGLQVSLKRISGGLSSASSGRLLVRGELTVHGPENDLLLYDRLFEQVVEWNGCVDFRVPKSVFPTGMHKQNRDLSASFRDTQFADDDAYLIRCEMIVSRERATDVANNDDRRLHLEKLSNDLKKLLLEGRRFSDVSVHTATDIMRTHKAILHARSPVLSDILKVSQFVNSRSDDGHQVEAVLLHAYSGNPDLLLQTVDVEAFGQIAQIAKQWQLRELENILTPVRMLCVSRVRHEECLFTWKIKNVTGQLNTEGSLHSSEFVTTHQSGRVTTNTRWKLILETRPGQNTLSLYLAKVDDNNDVPQKVDLEMRLYVERSDVEVARSREYVFSQRSAKRCGFANFCSLTHAMSRIIRDDALNVECKMKFSLDPEESWLQYAEVSLDADEPGDPYSLKYLQSLSRDLKELHRSQAYGDLKLCTSSGIFVVHKAILWARSPYFANVLTATSAEYVSVPIDDETLRGVLLYAYSAELPHLSPSNAQRLYEASFLLKMQELHLVCRFYILTIMTVDNVLEIMVMAGRCGDKDLELAAENFASTPANARKIIKTTRWFNFRSNYAEYAMRIYHKLCIEFLRL